jgi:hypothetical protein
MGGDHYFWLTLRRGVAPEQLPSFWERAAMVMPAGKAPGGGDLPDIGTFLEIQGAELSSVRKVDGHTEIRIWNPSQEPREAKVAGRVIRLGPARIETIRLD